jgi:CPA1 family monovalent cation:H+ antiporter
MDQFVSTETLIIELLLIASLVAIVVRRLRIPYTVALVVVGLLLTTQSPLKLELTPELILAFFVPPLVFEAAFHLNFNELRRNLGSILILAVPGVLLTTLIVGGVLSFGTGLALPVAMVFGSLIAATDPVAVVALFRLLGVPKRLSVLVEGESLLNDGTALVMFNLMLAIVLTGEFNLLDSVVEFGRVATGGIVLGFLLGWLVSRLIAKIDDYLIEITLTTVLAYGAYLLAEQMHFSGVLAVVAAGLITGNVGPQGMSPTTRIVLYNFWEYITFLVNSMVFLLIGLEVDISALAAAWKEILWAIGAVLAARFIVIYVLSWITNKVSEPISVRWRHVMFWGGLRGALSLALALSLPLTFGPDRDLIRTMAFGVALFTLLIQGTTMGGLVKRLGIVMKDEKQVEYSMRHARLNALRSAETHMERRYREGLLSAPAYERIKNQLQEQIALLADAVREMLRIEPVLEAEELETNRREVLRALRSSYLGMRADGIISDEVFEKLAIESDVALEEGGGPFWFLPQASLPERLKNSLEDSAQVEQIHIEEGSVCDGQLVKDIPWPQRFVIASLRRGNRIMIPKGDAQMKAGDILMVVGEEEDIEEARFFCIKSENGEK